MLFPSRLRVSRSIIVSVVVLFDELTQQEDKEKKMPFLSMISAAQ
jgi:hypothetical protein